MRNVQSGAGGPNVADWGAAGLLFQVDPGWESSVAHGYLDSLGDPAGYHSYYALGASDLCVLSFGRTLSPDFTHLSPLPHVRNVNHFMAFGWEQYSTSELQLDWSVPLAKIGFIKLSPELALSHGISAEWAIADAVVARARAYEIDFTHRLSVMGGLGWADLVYLVLGDDFSQLHGFSEAVLADIQDARGRPALCRGQSIALISLPVMDCLRKEALAETARKQVPPDLFSDRSPESLLPPVVEDALPHEACGSHSSILGTVTAEITCTCRSGRERYVTTHLQRVADLVGLRAETLRMSERHRVSARLHLPGARTGEVPTRLVLKTLSLLTAPYQEQPGLVSTATRLHYAPSRVVARPRPLPIAAFDRLPNLTVEFDADQLVSLLEEYRLPGQLASWLAEMYFRYNSVVRRPEFLTTFGDMRWFMQSQWDTATAESWLADPEQYLELLENLSEIFAIGFSQRAKGVFFSNELEPLPLVNGSAERAVHACDFVCRDVLRQAEREPWTGFCYFGNTIGWQRGYAGVMNLPMQHLLLPERWYGLMHEIGHEYSQYYDPLEGAASRQQYAADSYLQRLLPEGGSVADLRSYVLWEIAADLFDFRCGFRGDWEFLGRSVWQFLATFPLTQSQLEAYALRHFCVFMYATRRDASRGSNVAEAFTDFRAQIARWVDEVDPTIRPRLNWDARLSSPDIQKAYLLLEEWVVKRVWPSVDRLPRGTKVRDYWDDLVRGTVLREGFSAQDIVLSLWRHRDEIEASEATGFRARIAAILSLWNAEMRKGLLAEPEESD